MNEEQQTTERREVVNQQGNERVERETVAREATVSGRTIAVRIVWFIVEFIVVLLALRMALLLLGANQGNAFVDAVYGLSGVFASPFYGIFNYTPAYGNSVFEISSLVAIVIYSLLGWGIAKALTITSARQA